MIYAPPQQVNESHQGNRENGFNELDKWSSKGLVRQDARAGDSLPPTDGRRQDEADWTSFFHLP
jgi:hypothetical protein